MCIFIQKQHAKFFPLTGYTFSFLITYVRVPRCINFLMTPCQVRVREKEKTHFKSPWKSIFISSLNLFLKLKSASFGHLLFLELIFQRYRYYYIKEITWIYEFIFWSVRHYYLIYDILIECVPTGKANYLDIVYTLQICYAICILLPMILFHDRNDLPCIRLIYLHYVYKEL